MNKKFLTLVSRIREELSEVKRAVDRSQAGWERSRRTGDEFYLDSVALNLHSFYTALERMEMEEFLSFLEIRGRDQQ